MTTVRFGDYSIRVMGRLKTSGSVEVRKGFLEEVSLEMIEVEKLTVKRYIG